MTKNLNIFALHSDVVSLFEEITTNVDIKFTLVEPSSVGKPSHWSDVGSLPNLGKADGSQSNDCSSYLITLINQEVISRKIDQCDGKLRFDVDQLLNPHSIVFRPAGSLKGNVILAGSFGTASDSPTSQFLMKSVGTALRKKFTKIHAYWVGPEALDWLKKGMRLTVSEEAPATFDLQYA